MELHEPLSSAAVRDAGFFLFCPLLKPGTLGYPFFPLSSKISPLRNMYLFFLRCCTASLFHDALYAFSSPGSISVRRPFYALQARRFFKDGRFASFIILQNAKEPFFPR